MNEIINRLIAQLIAREPSFPWFAYIHNTYMLQGSLQNYLTGIVEYATGVVDLTEQPEDPFAKLANLLASDKREFLVYVRTDYRALEFATIDPLDIIPTHNKSDCGIFIDDYLFYIIID